MGPAGGGRPVALIAAGAVALLLALEVAVSLLVVDGYRRFLEPELRLNAQAAGRSLARRIGQALGYGIPLDGLIGLDEVVEPLMRQVPELARVALVDPAGRVVYLREGAPADVGGAEPLALPPILAADGREVARLELAVSRAPMRRRLGAATVEVGTVAAVAALATVEFLILMIGRGVAAPLGLARRLLRDIARGRFTHVGLAPVRGEAARLVAALAAVIRRANVPARGDDAAYAFAPGGGPPAAIPADDAPGARLALFLLAAGIGMALPFLAAVGPDRGAAMVRSATLGLALAGLGAVLPHRPSFRIVAAVAAAGPVVGCREAGAAAASLAAGLAGLGLGAALAAVGARAGGPRREGFLLGGALAAAACGPALGGMLAEVAGPGAALASGAILAGSAALAYPHDAPARRRPALARVPWRDWRLLAVGLLGAAPARLLLAGFVALEVPWRLAAAGAGWAEIGRAQMLWALPAVALTPLLGALLDRWRGGEGLLVGLGGIVGGVALIPSLFVDPAGWMPAAALLVGVGQAAANAGLPRLALRVGRRDAAAPAVPRCLGWVGAAAGPFAFAALGGSGGGDAAAMALVGAGAAAAAVLLSTLLLWAGYEPEPRAEVRP